VAAGSFSFLDAAEFPPFSTQRASFPFRVPDQGSPLSSGLLGPVPITMENGEKIKEGMSEQQVKAILGEPTYATDLFGEKTDSWQDKGNLIMVVFKKNKASNREINIWTNGFNTRKSGF
jgi:hypothetical protein